MQPAPDYSVGAKVRVLNGKYVNQEGSVEMFFSTETKFGTYTIAWVRMPDGHIDGFKPENLEVLPKANAETATHSEANPE
jgi:hypothetical protein